MSSSQDVPVPFSSLSEFAAAVEDAVAAAAAYYESDTLMMSDDEYDVLVDRITVSKAAHPEWDDRGVTSSVAAGQSAGGTVMHPVPMLSMAKSKDPESVTAFLAGLPAGVLVVVEPKLDGVAIRAEYEDGHLVLLVTRGDGLSGERVPVDTVVDGLPPVIDVPGRVEVRGEVFMTDTDFERSNTARVGSGKPGFANPRNAVAGTLRRETRTYEAFMSFAAYDASGDTLDTVDDYAERMSVVEAAGVRTAIALAAVNIDTDPTNDPVVVMDRIARLGEVRDGLTFGIDGAVVKVVSMQARDELGAGSRAPKWATAFKYPPVEGSSFLAAIEVAVGRTGRMSVTGVLEPPVFIDGSTVGRATLHHTGFIAEQGLGIGSKVIVEKRGDIIPRITAALEADVQVEPWSPPLVHDVCGQPWDTSEVIWRCVSPECSTVSRIAYAASRDVLDIDGLGAEVATALVDAGLVSNVADLYDLTVEQVAETRIGTTSTGNPKVIGTTVATKIVNGIEAAKSQPLARHLTSLGIRTLGRTFGRRLAAHFGTLENVRTATVDDLMAVDGIAAEKAAYIHDGLAAMSDVLDRMVAAGITTTSAPDATGVDLTGKTYVVSGAVPGYTRTTISERIEALGGKTSSSVTKNTTALITAETTTSKAKKAAELGIPVIDPTEFAALIAG